MTERALETDTAVREADLRGVLTFLQIRHGAWCTSAPDNPHRPIYAEARESAIREVLWRFSHATFYCRTCGALLSPDSFHRDE